MNELQKLETWRRDLALADTIEEIKMHEDAASALAQLARRQQISLDKQNEIGKYRIAVEEKKGDWLKEHYGHGGDRKSRSNHFDLDSMPTTKHESARARKIANTAKKNGELLESIQQKIEDSGDVITPQKVYKEIKKEERKKDIEEKKNREENYSVKISSVEFDVKPGQTWLCGSHKVICGDINELHIKADAIITDPPYGIDYTPNWNKWDGSKTDYNKIHGDNKEFDPTPYFNYKTVLLFGANYFTRSLPLGGWLCWDKRVKDKLDNMIGNPFELAWYRSDKTSKKAIMVRVLHGGVVNADSINGNNDKRYHPTQKPIVLMEEIIKELTYKTDVVLDPFAGSGSTLLACENLGRNSISVEINPEYVEVILKRYHKLTTNMPCLE